MTGFCQQLFGAVDIGGRHLVELCRMAIHPGCNHDGGGDGEVAHDGALNRLPVDCHAERLTHARILERIRAFLAMLEFIAAGIKRNEDGAHFGTIEHEQILVRAQLRHVLGGQVGDDVYVAREQRGDTCGVSLDWRVDDVGGVALELVPPGGVRTHHDPLVGPPLLDHIGAGAVGVARGKGFFLRFVVLNALGLVLGRPVTTHHVERREVVEERWHGLIENQIDGVAIDLADFLDARHVDLHRALGLTNSLERKDHVVGGEVGTVMKLDALAQIEAPGSGGGRLPAGGECRLNLIFLVVAHQALVGVADDVVGGGVVLRMRVKREDVVLGSPAKLRRACRPCCEHERGAHGRKPNSGEKTLNVQDGLLG